MIRVSGCGCEHTCTEPSAARDGARRRVLWIVFAINVVLFAGEFLAGWWADSSALQADSLDALGDAGVYALSLLVVARSLRARAGAAFVKGGIQAVFGLTVLGELLRKVLFGATPSASLMATTAAVALAANVVCFVLLTRFRADDVNMRSVWLCSRNDVLANLGVIGASAAVYFLGAPWPDWAVAAAIAALFLATSWSVLRSARQAWQEGGATPVSSTAHPGRPSR